jgi:polar amino acid transport system substrate-binding protein
MENKVFRNIMHGLLIGIVATWSLSVYATQTITITIAAEDAWFPYSGKVDGKVQGIAVDIVTAAFETQGVVVKFNVVPYARCLEFTKNGHYLACFNMPRTVERENDVRWPDKPMYTTVCTIFTRKNGGAPPVSKLQDLEGKRVAVVRGYEYDDAFGMNTRIVRDIVDSDYNALRMLDYGRVDYVPVFDKAADYLFGKHAELRDRFTKAGQLAPVAVYLGFSKLHPDAGKYLDIFNEGFAAIQKNGELAVIEKRWKR